MNRRLTLLALIALALLLAGCRNETQNRIRRSIQDFTNTRMYITLYSLDKTDGSVLTSEVVNPDFDTGGLCQSPLVAGGKGLGFSTNLGRFMSTHSLNNCSGYALFIGGSVTDFVPISLPGSGGAGDVKEHPLSGNLWVANAPDGNSLTAFSTANLPLQEFDVIDADTLGTVGTIMRIAFDATGSRLWLLNASGDVYLINGPTVTPAVPALSSWGSVIVGLLFAGLAAYRVRAKRVEPS